MQNDGQVAPDGPAAGVMAAIRESVGADFGPIERSQSLSDDLRLDSLEFVALIQAVEDKLGIRLDEQEAAASATVGDLVALVERLCAAKGR